MREEHTYERLLQSLKDMQAQIEDRVRPVAAQVVQAEVDRLRALSERQRNVLNDCLAHIDESILSCRDRFKEYLQTRADLIALNERLATLGADPAQVPDDVPLRDLNDIIAARVNGLRMEGKI